MKRILGGMGFGAFLGVLMVAVATKRVGAQTAASIVVALAGIALVLTLVAFALVVASDKRKTR